jgi:hypothetical protein
MRNTFNAQTAIENMTVYSFRRVLRRCSMLQSLFSPNSLLYAPETHVPETRSLSAQRLTVVIYVGPTQQVSPCLSGHSNTIY